MKKICLRAIIQEMFDVVLFDLDGTLTDPFEGITNSIIYSLDKFGIKVEDKKALTPFIGPPLYRSFTTRCGLDDSDARKAVGYYREYFSEKGIYENTVYPDAAAVLDKLKKADKKLILATSKPEEFAVRILKHFKLDGYFYSVAGATMDASRSEKSDVIKYALEACSAAERKKAVMVGDRKHDVYGAKANAIKSIGVLYGFGSREELRAAGADFIAEKITDIPETVL